MQKCLNAKLSARAKMTLCAILCTRAILSDTFMVKQLKALQIHYSITLHILDLIFEKLNKAFIVNNIKNILYLMLSQKYYIKT